MCAEGWATVGAWPMARPHQKAAGGTCQLGKPRGCNLLVGPPLGVLRRCVRSLRPFSPVDSTLGNSEGESGCGPRSRLAQAGRAAAATRAYVPADPVTRELFCPETRAVGLTRRTIVTWLILPVVICLSQRLSHACLSISNYTAKLRMAH